MNKNLLKIAVIFALCAAASSASYAASMTGTTTLGGSSFSTSNKVSLYVVTNGTSGQFDGTVYSTRSKHTQGDKVIGAISGDPKMYYSTVSTGDTSIVSGAATTDTYSTWTSM